MLVHDDHLDDTALKWNELNSSWQGKTEDFRENCLLDLLWDKVLFPKSVSHHFEGCQSHFQIFQVTVIGKVQCTFKSLLLSDRKGLILQVTNLWRFENKLAVMVQKFIGRRENIIELQRVITIPINSHKLGYTPWDLFRNICNCNNLMLVDS